MGWSYIFETLTAQALLCLGAPLEVLIRIRLFHTISAHSNDQEMMLMLSLFLAAMIGHVNANIPAGCPAPILSYHHADDGKTPTFGCFVSEDSLCVHHGEDTSKVSVIPLPDGHIPGYVYRDIATWHDGHMNSVCVGTIHIPFQAYNAYENGNRRLILSNAEGCYRRNSGSGMKNLITFIDSACQDAMDHES